MLNLMICRLRENLLVGHGAGGGEVLGGAIGSVLRLSVGTMEIVLLIRSCHGGRMLRE